MTTRRRTLGSAMVGAQRSWRGRRSRRKEDRPDVAVLRTNPKDSSLPRLLTVLLERYRVTAVVWDRTGDYVCPVRGPSLSVVRSSRRGEYYRTSTVVSVALLQPWFLARTLWLRPRVVHAMDLDTGVIGLFAARALRVPFVYQCLDPYAGALPSGWPPALGRLVNRVENVVISRADIFMITDLKRLPQHLGARPKRVVELPNIPMITVVPQPFSAEGLVVGYIGSLVPHRSLEAIVDTVGSLADEGVSLVIGGFGPLEEDLRRRAARFDNVTFLGWVADDALLATMGTFDVFVQVEDPDHAAYRWVSPNKVFESMAFGRPIVVAAGTLAAERVAESGHGVTVRYGDSRALRDELRRLHDDRAHRSELGSAGSRSFFESWAPAAVASRFWVAYPAPGASGKA